MNMAPLDIVFLVILLLMTVRGVIVGFVNEFFSKAAVVLALLASIVLYNSFTPVVRKITNSAIIPEIISFLVIFLVVYVLVKILQKITASFFENESMASLDRALGLFLGIIEGLVIIGAVIAIMDIQKFFDLSAVTQGSFFYRFFSPFVSEAVNLTGSKVGLFEFFKVENKNV